MTTATPEHHVVVTGAGGPLGGAVLGALLSEGAICHVPVRHRKPREQPRSTALGKLHITPDIDVTDEDSCKRFYEGLPRLWASIHVVGGFGIGRIEETTLETFRDMMEINLISSFLCSREAVRAIRRSDDNTGGRIVNVTARAALIPPPGMLAYSTSKAAVSALTHALAVELQDEGIWVNAVAPSVMDTPVNRSSMPSADHSTWPKVEEVAETILFLASSQNKTTSGSVVSVYGRA